MDEEDDLLKKPDVEEESDGNGQDSSPVRAIDPPINGLLPVVGVMGVVGGVPGGGEGGVGGRLGEAVRGANEGIGGGRVGLRVGGMGDGGEAAEEADGDGDGDGLPQQAALAAQRGVRAAIRWALRGRNLEHNFNNDDGTGGIVGARERGGIRGGGGGGGGGEEIDEGDNIGDVEMTGEMVDDEINLARGFIIDADRRIRFAEIAARRALLGVTPRNNLDRRTRRREKTCLVRGHLQNEHRISSFLPVKSLPLHTPLCPHEHPRDFIAVITVDIILKEVVSVLDNLALELVPQYEKKIMNKKSNERRNNGNNNDCEVQLPEIHCDRENNSTIESENKNKNSNRIRNRDKDEDKDNNNNENKLRSLAIDVVRMMVRSPYRRLLVPGVFRVLLAHCGLRAKLAAADALER